MNDRRAFGRTLALALLATRQVSIAQARVYRLGILEIGEASQPSGEMSAFVDQLTRRGLVEGGNLVIDRRFAHGDRTLLDRLAAELVALKPDVIFTASGTVGALAARKATKTIPIVFDASNNPVAAGLVVSLPHPGGNLTGNALFGLQLDAKRLQILREVVGDRSSIAYLGGRLRDETQRQELTELSAADARSTGAVKYFAANSADTFAQAFERMARERIDGVVIGASPVAAASRQVIAGLVAQYRLPAIADGRGYAEAGLLLTYTADFVELYRRAADYVSKILKGARPDDLPVEHASRFEFVINLRTAKALGIRLPRSVLARADTVID